MTARVARRTGKFSEAERRALLGPYQQKTARRHLQNILLGIRQERPFFAALERRLPLLAERPVLFAYGQHDNGYAAGFLDRWRRLLPPHQVLLLRESAHFPLEDEPDRFVEGLAAWLPTTS